MENKYSVSPAPHLHENISVKSVMWWVAAALVPALLASVYYFGMRAFWLTVSGVVTAVLCEAIIQKLRKQEITISDGSAVVTGMLMAFNLHAASPIWLPAVGSIFAIAIGKQVFGGLGHNVMNPALLARAFLVASWPGLTTGGWINTKLGSMSGLTTDLIASLPEKAQSFVTSATPLGIIKALRDPSFVNGLAETADKASQSADQIMGAMTHPDTLQNLFLGNVGGVIGEVSAVALLIGAAFLAFKHIIGWRIPLAYIGTVFVLTFLFGGIGSGSTSFLLPVFHVFSGGLILGAFFMATDMVTSPVTRNGRLLFGIGCGVITVVIRLVGGYPEGVSYSILLMNIAAPLLDKVTLPTPFGGGKK